MFDEQFFGTSLPQHIDAKAKEGVDQPSLQIRLQSGQEYTVLRVLERRSGWVVLEVYPPGRKKPREHTEQDRKAGSPRYDFDRVALPYEAISLVVITIEPKSKGLGFQV